MAAKLGSSDVSFRLGAGEVAAVYLGSQEVWSAGPTVPGAPTITSGFAYVESGDAEIYFDPPASDGGSQITGYKYYVNGLEVTPDNEGEGFVLLTATAGDSVQVSAVNAVGEGPKSAPVTVA
jgi:hypothetical protein